MISSDNTDYNKDDRSILPIFSIHLWRRIPMSKRSVPNVPLDLSNLVDADNMEVYEVFANPNGFGPPLLIMLHDMSPKFVRYAVRLYTLKDEGHELAIHDEIATFAFTAGQTAIDFANRFQSMSAIEILLLMNANQEDVTLGLH